MTTQPPSSVPFDRDVVELHGREVARLVAYLASSDRQAGAMEAEDVAAEAFLEVASTWPSAGAASSPEVYLFACAHRIAVARSHLGRSGHGDALVESMPAFGDQADLARLAVLQDALDQLPAAPRYAVLLREMCGFTPSQSAEIIGLPEQTVEMARDDALRNLVPVVESGTLTVHARRGPLSPDDFVALSRVLQHPDARRLAERQRVAARLSSPSYSSGGASYPSGGASYPSGGASYSSGGASYSSGGASYPSGGASYPSGGASYPSSGLPVGMGDPGFPRSGSLPSWSMNGGSVQPPYPGSGLPFNLEPGWSKVTPLDAPLSAVDLTGTSTPIFDAISAWFASGASGNRAEWEALDDGNWREANARAASEPQVAGLSEAGLPKRRPGANTVPSAADVGSVNRSMFGEPPRVDAGQVRHRLGGFQQGVNNARRLRGRAQGAPAAAAEAEPERPWDPLFDPMPARRAGDASRSADQGGYAGPLTSPTGIGVGGGPGAASSGGRRDDQFREFQREQLPQVLAALMLQDARPADAAELAQAAFDEAYDRWTTLESPQEWTRDRALGLLAERRRTGG